MGGFTTATGLFVHKHSEDIAEGGPLSKDETKIDGEKLEDYMIGLVYLVM